MPWKDLYLEWTPEMMRDSLTTEVLKQWKLDGLLKYIKFPEDLKMIDATTVWDSPPDELKREE